MTDDDKKRFRFAFMGLGEVFQTSKATQATPANLRLYFDALKAHPIEQVEQACREHIGSGRFFPRPAELVALIEASRKAGAEVLRLEQQRGALVSPRAIEMMATVEVLQRHAKARKCRIADLGTPAPAEVLEEMDVIERRLRGEGVTIRGFVSELRQRHQGECPVF